MSSAAKIAANRRNARKSTGPRSQVGKMRSRRNSFRHGLAIPIRADIAFSDQIEPLMEALAEGASAQRQTVQMAALAQLELARAQRVKVQMINRAAQRLQEEESCELSELPALAYACQIRALAKLERYERRALSQRNRALRALAQSDKRNVNVFVEPVTRLEVTALVKAALAHPPQARYLRPAGWSGESYGTTFDLPHAAVLRVFIQCRDTGKGRMYVEMKGIASVAQTFAIAKIPTSFGGGKWVVICPTTGLAVANLYACAGTHEVKSRHALNLHYRSQRGHPPEQILSDHADASAWRQAFQRQSLAASTPVEPTGPANLPQPADGHASPRPVKPVDATSIAIDHRDFKAGVTFLAEGKLEEARAAYQNYRAICQAALATHADVRAAKQRLYRVGRLIGDLALKYLLLGAFEQALNCVEEVLTDHPNSITLNIIRAHVLMFLDRDAEAKAIYLHYRGKNMARGNSCDDFILDGFERLGKAGLAHRLLDEIEQQLRESTQTNQQSAEPVERVVETAESNQEQSAVADAALVEIDLGDKLRAEGKLAEAHVGYRHALLICKTRLAKDGTDSQAQYGFDLALTRIGHLAFDYLLERSVALAEQTIDEAISHRGHVLWLHLVRAYALMLGSRKTDALNIHRQNCLRTMDNGNPWGATIRADFAALRQAGFNLPIMDHIERVFGPKE